MSIQDSSVKITSEKSIFMYFLAQFWCFKVFALLRGGCQGDFLSIQIYKVLYTFYFYWLAQFPYFFKDLGAQSAGAVEYTDWFSAEG